MANPPRSVVTEPSGPGSTWWRPMNHESMPGPVAMAAQTSSTEASTTASSRSSHSCPTSGLLAVRALGQAVGCWMYGNDEAERSPTRGGLVVVLADEADHRAGELLGEGGPVGGRGEPHLTVECIRGHLLAGP